MNQMLMVMLPALHCFIRCCINDGLKQLFFAVLDVAGPAIVGLLFSSVCDSRGPQSTDLAITTTKLIDPPAFWGISELLNDPRPDISPACCNQSEPLAQYKHPITSDHRREGSRT